MHTVICAYEKCGLYFFFDVPNKYSQTHITSGEVNLIRCPEKDCPMEFDPNVIRALVSPVLYERYLFWLKYA